MPHVWCGVVKVYVGCFVSYGFPSASCIVLAQYLRVCMLIFCNCCCFKNSPAFGTRDTERARCSCGGG